MAGKIKKRQLKKARKKSFKRSEETLSNTTKSILKQNRTNPHANVLLSGKKKRKLLKEARRLVQEGLAMEVTGVEKVNNKSETTNEKSAEMETN